MRENPDFKDSQENFLDKIPKRAEEAVGVTLDAIAIALARKRHKRQLEREKNGTSEGQSR